MRNIILILLMALIGCNAPKIIIDTHSELQDQFIVGHCEAMHFLATFEAEFGVEELAGDWSIYRFLKEFQIPQVWTDKEFIEKFGEIVDYEIIGPRAIDYIWHADLDFSRISSYHLGALQAMKDWR